MAGMIQIPFGEGYVTRPEPIGTPDLYKTFGLSMPLKTHWRPANCEEVDCEAYLRGWVSTFDLSTDLGQKQYEYCRKDRSRSFSMQRPEMNIVKFVYPPGNACFRSGDHKVQLDRPARFYVAEGDFRGNPRGTSPRTHTRAVDWVDEFANHTDKIKTAVERG